MKVDLMLNMNLLQDKILLDQAIEFIKENPFFQNISYYILKSFFLLCF